MQGRRQVRRQLNPGHAGPPAFSPVSAPPAARHASFKAAARELHITPTAVSHQIRNLEQTLGQKLFDRQPRKIALTPAGSRLFPVLRDSLDRIGAVVAELSAKQTTPLVMTTTTAFARRWLIPRMERLRAACGGLDLAVRATEAVVDLHADQADLAIRYRRSPEPDLEEFPLFSERYLPVCSPRRLQQGPPVHEPADLLDHPLIHFQWKREDPQAPAWARWFAQARQQWQACPLADTGSGLWFSEEMHAIEAAIEGQGIALLSNVIIERELANGSLVPVLDFAIEGLTFYLVYRYDSPRQQAILYLAAAMRAEVGHRVRTPHADQE